MANPDKIHNVPRYLVDRGHMNVSRPPQGCWECYEESNEFRPPDTNPVMPNVRTKTIEFFIGVTARGPDYGRSAVAHDCCERCGYLVRYECTLP